MNDTYDRGGFQNRDIGRSSFNNDFGPEQGPDYARYAGPVNETADRNLKQKIEESSQDLPGIDGVKIQVRNGFVFIQGMVKTQEEKLEWEERIWSVEGVYELINLLRTNR